MIDNTQLLQLKEKYERDIQQADKKRRQTREERKMKLRMHLLKVEEIRKENAEKKQSSVEEMKKEIEDKLEHAEKKRDHNLD